MAEQEDTGIAILSHLSGLIGAFVIPIIGGIIGPLVIYTSSDEGFGKENARNALNWQISLLIWGIVIGLISLPLIFLAGLGILTGFAGLTILGVLDLVFILLASVKASDGEAWEYPLTYDFV